MTGPLRVRMGLHTCEAELRDGDYYGSAVNRAARLMSVAHGGQIVVSAATSELLRGGSVELVDLGDHRLRDLGEPERVFQIAHPELEREFPALQSVDELPGNLPVQPNAFVGRARVDRADRRAGRRHRGGHAHRTGRCGKDEARLTGRGRASSPSSPTARGWWTSRRCTPPNASPRCCWRRWATHWRRARTTSTGLCARLASPATALGDRQL